ncbi:MULTISPECIES: outer membrane protein [Methylorubrum]|uniref:outer membrane protein n=1 Tax=Methylorubrum TaxID=2282523 RepID=UPI0020A12F2F|nr:MULTISPECIES: outer membrane beta-barrel protein [Methylorubrum]MCP1550888.1 opacity protein-like surface antigen [Methylorubrum zatmanii]MCP1552499.1 opacity protein-like surface antigen [Methylorubrum extorquens]MCP1581191.1 opacity protein-like surface antigen [Methylorubrum extorquens]
MRIATLAFLTTILASPALAADLDYGVLRGYDDDYPAPAPLIDWSGFYVGGHGGYSSAALGFSNAFQPIVANALRNTVAEAEMSASHLLAARATHSGGASYGVFAGVNYQFEDVVVGLEADYTYFGQSENTFDRIARTMITKDEFLTTVNLDGYSSTKIQDYGTVRGRLGYAFGNLLPFITGGAAVGRATVTDTVTVQNYGYNNNTYNSNQTGTTKSFINNYGYSVFYQDFPPGSIPAPGTVHGTTKKVTVVGLAVGGGLEYAITPNFLLRGEYQYVLFNDFQGHKAELNTVRGGAAIKF